MPVPKVPQLLEDVRQGLSKAADVLGELTETIDAVSGAPRDVNNNPLDASGNILDQAREAVQDVHKAAQLRQMLPWVFVAGGFLLGKPLLGIALGLVVAYAGEDLAPAPAPTGTA